VSSNVAKVVANVATTIQDSTGNTSHQQQICKTNVHLYKCWIGGNFNLKNVCKIVASSQQILQNLEKTNLKTTISQKLLQEATSTVGAMGVGYADASNIASAYSSVTNDIVSAVTNICKQYSSLNTNFTCEDSVIRGNVSIFNYSSANFLSTQLLESKRFDKIANTITQSVTQKATAKIEGILGFIMIIVALIIGALYIIEKPLNALLKDQLLLIFVIIIALVIIFVALYLFKAPPLFNDPNQCISNNDASGCQNCINIKPGKMKLDNTPLRYLYPLIGRGDVSLGQPSSGFVPGLLQCIIQKYGGWTKNVNNVNGEFKKSLNSSMFNKKGTFPADFPEILLIDVNQSPVTNIKQWNSFIGNNQPNNAALVRNVFCELLNIPLDVYMFGNETCARSGNIISNSKCMKFSVNSNQSPYNVYTSGLQMEGVLSGPIGVCDTRNYKFQQFMRTKGIYITGGIFILLIIIFMIRSLVGGKTSPKEAAVSPKEASVSPKEAAVSK